MDYEADEPPIPEGARHSVRKGDRAKGEAWLVPTVVLADGTEIDQAQMGEYARKQIDVISLVVLVQEYALRGGFLEAGRLKAAMELIGYKMRKLGSDSTLDVSGTITHTHEVIPLDITDEQAERDYLKLMN